MIRIRYSHSFVFGLGTRLGLRHGLVAGVGAGGGLGRWSGDSADRSVSFSSY